jgi:hypothetical protein
MMQAYQIAYEKAVAALAALDLHEAARRRGAALDGRRLELAYFGQPVGIEVPTEAGGEALFQPPELPLAEKILILHYLAAGAGASAAPDTPSPGGLQGADGPQGTGRLVSFQQLAGASFYEPTYRKRGPARIARRFGEDLPAFTRACRALGWTEERLGDAAYGGPVLPRVRCVAVLHRGDEEFPAEVNLLFSDAIAAFLPLEDVAVLAGLVATRLTRAAQESGR